MSYLLHPPLLDEVGLASAAEWFVEGFSKRTGISVNFAVKGEKRRLGQATELTLFRVLQESLTNIHRHAKASAAEVILKYDGNQVALRVLTTVLAFLRGSWGSSTEAAHILAWD